MINQISAEERINISSKISVTVILKEYTQIYDIMFSKLNPYKLSIEENKQALRIITLIKDKVFSKIKGCACADVIPQIR